MFQKRESGRKETRSKCRRAGAERPQRPRRRERSRVDSGCKLIAVMWILVPANQGHVALLWCLDVIGKKRVQVAYVDIYVKPKKNISNSFKISDPCTIYTFVVGGILIEDNVTKQ